MKILTKKDVYSVPCDVLAIGMFENEENEFTKHIDSVVHDEIGSSLKKKDFTGESGQYRLISTHEKISAKNVLVVGLGKKKEHKLENLRRASASAIKVAMGIKAKTVATAIHKLGNEKLDEKAMAVCEGSLLATYNFNRYKSEDKTKPVEELFIAEDADLENVIHKAQVLAESVFHVRDIINTPANIATPAFLAEEAEKLKKVGVEVKVFDKKELQRMGFGALLAVASGSALEPKFVVMEYGKGKEAYAFIGKGITFDSGGLDLKPTKYMEDMKMDKAGAATVIGVIEVAAKLKMPVHIVCAFPACENMPSGSSFKPGDILTGYNKKTIEMMNSDAEGRLVLSDAIAYIEKEYKPSVMFDMATLTGACVVALGYWATGMLSDDDKLCAELVKAGEETYERVWRLPLWEEYKENLKSDIADVRNVGKGYDAGTIEGAWFLKHFVEKVPWVHLDIAGTAWFDSEKYYFKHGATGVGVRLLIKWMEGRIRK